MNATIFDISRNSFVDGPGIRTTVFFKGCNLKCKWCHNPESQAFQKQMLFYKNKCTGCGKCAEICPNNLKNCDFCEKCTFCCPAGARNICGKEYTEDELLKEILKDKIFYETSGGGVTFSGGECMLRIDFLEKILKKCKSAGVHSAVDTAGNVPFEYFEKIMPYTDIFLYDIKAFSDDLHIEGTGVSNKRILENLKKLSAVFKGDIIIRIPVIPGYNDSEDEMKKISDFAKTLNVKETELMPYHKLGEHKYEALEMAMTEYQVPSEEKINELKKLF